MNILNTLFLHSCNGIFLFKENILSEVISNPKRMTAVALAILSCWTAFFTAYKHLKGRKVSHLKEKHRDHSIKNRGINKKQTDLKSKPLTIFLKMDRTEVYRVEKNETILSFKRKIFQREGYPYPLDTLRLIWSGHQLEDHQTFEGYHIRNESTIHATLRLAGD